MKSMVLEPLDINIQNDDYIRKCNILRFDDNIQVDKKVIFFQFPISLEPPDSDDCDSYLIAVLMDAMYEGRSIKVKGSVSKKLLSNLVEYQGAWNKWVPDIYKFSNIEVESVREDGIKLPGAVCAFSGGVDATFSVWRNTQKKNSYRSQEIKLCSLIHGFDIPLSDSTAYTNVFKQTTSTLKDINIKLVPIRTNFREISKVNWNHSHSCALVATLGNFKSVAGTCIIGSSASYNNITLPWGSNPVTDHLLSSDGFEIIHDGASHNRIEKIKEISEWKTGINNLHVCWEGDLKDRNCGKCEKCMRTKLSFLAIGEPIPTCFPDTGENINIKNLRIENAGVRLEWKEILESAKHNSIKEKWVNQISRIVRRKPLKDLIFPRGSRRRKIVKYLMRMK